MCLRIFLSPEGDDSNSGSQEAPLKNLDAALKRIRKIKLIEGGVKIILRDGLYPLTHALKITDKVIR